MSKTIEDKLDEMHDILLEIRLQNQSCIKDHESHKDDFKKNAEELNLHREDIKKLTRFKDNWIGASITISALVTTISMWLNELFKHRQ